ncbi:MAG: hypothetical protein JXR10_09315 [Cyclobacteriaceae bacterium]
MLKKKDPSSEEHLREIERLVKTPQLIEFVDPKSEKVKKSSLKSLAKRVSSSRLFSLFLKRLIENQGYTRVLETGTSLGINTACIATAPNVKVWTIEGSKEIARCAQSNFDQLDLKNIELIQGLVVDEFIPALELAKPQLVFLDADHRSQTIEFYLESIHNSSAEVECIIIHDIYWSKDMRAVWEQIVSDPAYQLTIDIFEAGIIFPNYPMTKQHFTLAL